MLSALQSALEAAGKVAEVIGGKLAHTFLAPGSLFSLASLACALVVAVLFLSFKRPGKRLRLKALIRALFPRRMVRAASTKADVGFFLFNTFAAGILFGWAVISGHLISQGAHGLLVDVFGHRTTMLASGGLSMAVVTFATFLAYEFGYWIDHALKHKVPFLWEFHKVHHTAEHLTPLTNFRMHPVDSLLFANILAVTIGATTGVTGYALGREAAPLLISGSNAILVVFVFVLLHLQHTQLWIAFTGIWGRLLVSPAHHQLHHSDNPEHFGKNFGSCLAIWDWMFGTLHAPTKAPQKLTFGVSPISPVQHSVTGCLITPFVLAIEVTASAATHAFRTLNARYGKAQGCEIAWKSRR